MSIEMYCNQNELTNFKREFNQIVEINLFGRSFFVSKMSYTMLPWHTGMYKVLFDLVEVDKKKQPKSEAELQLEQTIKLTQQDIEHKNRLIEQYEEKRAALEKKRLDGV